MAAATKKAKPKAAGQRAVVRSLGQQVAAELIDKPAVWLRDNPNIACRNDDDSYDGVKLVRRMLAEAPVAELDDEQLEGVLQVVETCLRPDGRYDLALAAVQSVEQRHGTAGLAAVGAELLRHLAEWSKVDPYAGPKDLPNEDEYVERAAKEAADEARQRHQTIAVGWNARQQGRELYVCANCRRYRLGRFWHTPPLPIGYVASRLGAECPPCSKKA